MMPEDFLDAATARSLFAEAMDGDDLMLQEVILGLQLADHVGQVTDG